MVVNNNNTSKTLLIGNLNKNIINIKNTAIVEAVATSIATSITNTEIIIEVQNGTYVHFFTYNGAIIDYFIDYSKAVNNYNSVIDNKLNFANVDIDYNDLKAIDDLITIFNNKLFLGPSKSIKSSIMNMNLLEGYNKLLSVPNLDTINSLETTNKYKNDQIGSYISWNTLKPKHLYYINNYANNFIINFGPTIYDELLCLNKLLYSFNEAQSIENNYLFYLVSDNTDYIDILKYCCLKGHYLEIYNLKSTNTNNNIFNEYNLDNKIDDITTPLPDFSPNKLVNNNYEIYIKKVIANRTIYDFSYIGRDKTKTCKFVLINIPLAENVSDKNNFHHGKAINKSLDVMLRVYNTLSITEKANSKIYVKTNSSIGEKTLVDYLLESNPNFNINALVANSQFIISSKTNIDAYINKLNNANKQKLNNLLCINNYYFYKKSVHAKIIDQDTIKTNVPFTYSNLNVFINTRKLNLGYIDSLWIDLLIHKDVENNNANNIVNSVISSSNSNSSSNSSSNERYKNTGANLFKEYDDLILNGIQKFVVDANLNTNFPNNRKNFINNCLADIFGEDLINNFNSAYGSSFLAGLMKPYGFTSNKRNTYFRLFKKNIDAFETISLNSVSNDYNCEWEDYNPTGFTPSDTMKHRYEIVDEDENNYLLNSVYDEIVLLHNNISVLNTINTAPNSVYNMNLSLNTIDFSNSVLNKSTSIQEIISNNTIEYYINYDIAEMNFYKSDGVTLIQKNTNVTLTDSNIVIAPTTNYDFNNATTFIISLANKFNTYNIPSNLCNATLNFVA